MNEKVDISLLALPDVILSSLAGMHDVLGGFELLAGIDDRVPDEVPFTVNLVGPSDTPIVSASGVEISPDRLLEDTDPTDVVIIPSVRVEDAAWVTGRYPEVVDWLRERHSSGALLGSACSGGLLLAETGLLDGLEATVHWAYGDTFRRHFPDVRLRLDEVLVTSGHDDSFVMAGASASWTDLVLYLIARTVGPSAAQAIASFFVLQWHSDGQSPYVMFTPLREHGDAAILGVQDWLDDNYDISNPVENMTERSGLSERTFHRRFKRATGHTPISYTQHLRVEKAKRFLEQTDIPAEEVCFEVGYLEPGSFRRLFKRITNVTPADYRRRFRIPGSLTANR